MKGVVTMTAEEAFLKHKKAFETWTHGDIEQTWVDEAGNLCIEYSDGEWWHYNLENNQIVWW